MKSTKRTSGAKAIESGVGRAKLAVHGAVAAARARGIDLESVGVVAMGLVALGLIALPALDPSLPAGGELWAQGAGLRGNHNASLARDRG